MKKKWSLLVLLALSALLAMTACGSAVEVKFYHGEELLQTTAWVTGGENEIPKDPEKPGYRFAGWSEKKDGTAADVVDLDTFDPKASTSLYAVFVEQMTVKISVNGTLTDKTLDVGSSVKDLGTMEVAEGFVFKGWSKTDGGEILADQTALEKNTVYYAVTEKVKITVTFHVGDKQTQSAVEYGECAEEPQQPVKEGFRFLHWSVSENGDAFDFKTKLKENLDLYAVFVEQIRVTLSVNGQETEKSFDLGTTAERLESPLIPQGYRFEGWSLTEGGEILREGTPLEDGETYYAVFVKQVTVTYHIDGAETEVTGDLGAALVKPEDPRKDGYRFSHWSLSANGEAFDFTGATFGEDMDLYAVFVKQVSVTYHIDGNTAEQVFDYGTKLIRPEDPEKTGYRFSHWSTTENGEAFSFENAVLKEDISLYAVFVEQITVTLHAGNETREIVMDIDTALEKPVDPQAPQSYRFDRWSLTENGEAFDFDTKLTENTDLYAVFIRQYQVTIDDGTGPKTQVVDEGTTLDVSDPKKEGFRFDGWVTEDGSKFDFGSTPITSDLSVTAKFVEQITVTLSVDGKTETHEIDIGTSFPQPEDPQLDHKRLVRWSLSENGTEAFDFSTELQQNTTIYAVLEDVVYVTFRVNGEILENRVLVKGEALGILPKPENIAEDYRFKHWSEEENGGRTSVTNTTKIEQDLVLYAVFKHWYTVTFIDGEEEVSLEREEGTILTKDNVRLTKEGHTLVGGTLDRDEHEKLDFILGETPLTENLTLYAVWSVNEYRIDLYYYGNSVNETLTEKYGSLVTLNALQNQGNLIFEGWYSDSDFKTKISGQDGSASVIIGAKDVSYYAKWRIETDITLTLNNGDDTNMKVVYGDSFGWKMSILSPNSLVTEYRYMIYAMIGGQEENIVDVTSKDSVVVSANDRKFVVTEPYTLKLVVSTNVRGIFIEQEGHSTLTVTKRATEVTVENQYLHVGDEAAPFVLIFSNLAQGDTAEDFAAEGEISTDYTKDSAAGTYVVSVPKYTNPNYEVVSKEGYIYTSLEITINEIAVEYDVNNSEPKKTTVYATSSQDQPLVLEEGFEFRLTTDTTVSKGGTYLKRADLVSSPELFTVTNTSDILAVVKVRSVLVGDSLYTAEDALAINSGEAVVTADTSFATKEVKEHCYNDAKYYTVKLGSTLLVPFDATHSFSLKEGDRLDGAASAVDKNGGYVTLTLPEGTQLNVEGTLLINAYRACSTSSDFAVSGTVYQNKYGTLALEANSSVTVKNGGTFNSLGFTIGSGEVIAERGAKVYETMSIYDYKGGSITMAIYKYFFPFNQFGVNNIEAKLTLQPGAKMYGQAFMSPLVDVYLDLYLIGEEQEGGMDPLIQTESATVEKTFDNKTGRTTLKTNGNIEFNNIKVSATGITLDTANTSIPFAGNWDICVESGKLTAKDVKLKLLPGARLTVGENASVELLGNSYIFVYGETAVFLEASRSGDVMTASETIHPVVKAFKDGNNNLPYPAFYALGMRANVTIDFTETTPAQLILNGTATLDGTSRLAGEIKGTGTLTLSAAEPLTVFEDYTVYKKFLASATPYAVKDSARGKIGGELQKLEAGTYKGSAEGWTKQEK